MRRHTCGAKGGLEMKTVRGRVQRDTSQGEGLVFVEGQQHSFKLEGLWKSEVAPSVNMSVDVDFDDAGNLVALRAVNAQTLASENAAKALEKAQGTAKDLAANFQDKGLPVLLALASRIGYPVLAAWGALVIGWYFLAAAVAKVPYAGEIKLTFHQVLALINASESGLAGLMQASGGAGFYGFLALATLVAVFLPQVWSDRRAHFGRAAPLVFMLLALVIVYFKLKPDTAQAAAQFGGRNPQMEAMMQQMANEAAAAARKAISLGLGFYVSAAASLYLAVTGFLKGIGR